MNVTENVRLLLVDDDPTQLLVLESLLASLDHSIVKASSGREALERAATGEFALILLDVMMPGMDGFTTANLLRQQPKSANTPIIFLTAHLDLPSEVLAGYDAGAVDYIIKPANPHILRSKVRAIATQFQLTQQLRRNNECLESANRELRAAIEQINLLRGLLRICAKCKRIEGEPEKWVEIEQYVRDHSSAEFSHGLCPECAQEAEVKLRAAIQARRYAERLAG